MTRLRAVRPRNACEPGSFVPSYASTPVSRTATPSCRSTAPSRRDATSVTGPVSRPGRSGVPATTLHRRTVTVGTLAELCQLLADPVGGGPAATVSGGDGSLGRQDRADLGGQRRRDR